MSNHKLRILTINIGQFMVEDIDLLVEKGYIASRSEFIRMAVSNELRRLRKTFRGLHQLIAELPDHEHERQLLPEETHWVDLHELPKVVQNLLAERRD